MTTTVVQLNRLHLLVINCVLLSYRYEIYASTRVCTVQGVHAGGLKEASDEHGHGYESVFWEVKLEIVRGS